MTQSYYKKAFKQLRAKPVKMAKFIKHCAPKERSCGKANHRCKVTGSMRGYIGKYGIGVCRQQFRDIANQIGFKKYN